MTHTELSRESALILQQVVTLFGSRPLGIEGELDAYLRDHLPAGVFDQVDAAIGHLIAADSLMNSSAGMGSGSIEVAVSKLIELGSAS